MQIVVNALSLTNLSGPAVMGGHLSQLIQRSQHRFRILCHDGNRAWAQQFADRAAVDVCPSGTASWARRALWETTQLRGLLRRTQADLMLNPTGTIVPGLDLPQLSYAMNPWAFVEDFPKRRLDRVKALMQLRGYRRAMRQAAGMLFLSRYMQELFEADARTTAQRSQVVHTGIDDDVLVQGAANDVRQKDRMRILCVSVMAPHKDIETLLKALQHLRSHHRLAAHLVLAGPWAYPGYEARIRELIAVLDLGSCVEITGKLSREALHQQYAEAGVYCLMSRCESFGIPAVEAQAFGTPVVSSNCCAIPEVCGDGGTYPAPGDVPATANALAQLLTDDQHWQMLSARALKNAARYQWQQASEPLLEFLDKTALAGSA